MQREKGDLVTRRYSALSLIREGLNGQRGWEPAWREAKPKAGYDAVIIGGGGHGLATAYYLAKNHGMTNIAVIERGRSEEHTSELQSLMRISYAVFCLKKKKIT